MIMIAVDALAAAWVTGFVCGMEWRDLRWHFSLLQNVDIFYEKRWLIVAALLSNVLLNTTHSLLWKIYYKLHIAFNMPLLLIAICRADLLLITSIAWEKKLVGEPPKRFTASYLTLNSYSNTVYNYFINNIYRNKLQEHKYIFLVAPHPHPQWTHHEMYSPFYQMNKPMQTGSGRGNFKKDTSSHENCPSMGQPLRYSTPATNF